MKLPRLYVNGKFERFVNPVNVSITQNMIPLDTASMTLPFGEELPARSYVELFTPYGSAGYFRVRSPHDAYGQDTTTAELEHAISEVGDYIVKEEISEMLPANEAMQRIFSHYQGTKWKLGSLALGTDLIACEAKYDRVLDDMLALLEQTECMMAFDFTTSPWTVNIVRKGNTVTAEGRLSRNVSSASITYDDSELCTRVWYQTFNKKKEATWNYKDAPTVSKWGIVEGTVRTSADMTAEEILKTVDAYIADHKNPRISVDIQAVELSRITGESMDKFTCGKLMRLNLVDYGVTASENIRSITWNDVYGNPSSVSVHLGDEEDTVVTFLHNLDAKGGGGGGGGRAKEKEEEAWSRFKTDYAKTDEYISFMALEQDEQRSILNQAGMILNSEKLLVYAKGKNTIGSKFEVQKDLISLVVSGDTPEEARIEVGNITNAYNGQSGSYIKLKARNIDLSGYVTMSDLKATNARITNLMTGNATASKIICDDLRLPGSLYYHGYKYVPRYITFLVNSQGLTESCYVLSRAS